jgi:hypothetical protein
VKIADIMDSPIVAPKGYDGDVYFTIEHTNGKFDMVQLDTDKKKVMIDRDLDNGPAVGLVIELSDLAEILGVPVSESSISESMMSEIDIIGQESETREQFVNDVTEFLKKHAHNKEAATNKASIEKLAGTYFNEDGSKKDADETPANEAILNEVNGKADTAYSWSYQRNDSIVLPGPFIRAILNKKIEGISNVYDGSDGDVVVEMSKDSKHTMEEIKDLITPLLKRHGYDQCRAWPNKNTDDADDVKKHGEKVNEAAVRRSYKDYVSRKKAEYGDKFDESDLDPRFIPFYESGERIKIDDFGRTIGGTVGITTGWKPVFLLMRTSRSTGSSDILDKSTKIVK